MHHPNKGRVLRKEIVAKMRRTLLLEKDQEVIAKERVAVGAVRKLADELVETRD